MQEKKSAELLKNKEEDMNACKVILLFVLIVSCWNCAEPELGIDEETLPDTELNSLFGDIRVMDILLPGYPEAWGDATFNILNSSMGYKLLKHVKALNPKSAFIHFKPILGEDGYPDMSVEIMAYAGSGLIRYTGKAAQNGCKDELLFHEFFHIFQNGIENPPRKSLNNELEAYLAQYFYSENKSSSNYAGMIDRDFREKLVALASCINMHTGYLKVSYDEFYQKYVEALNYIANIYPYDVPNWIRDQAEYNEQPFPKLFQLLNQQS